MSLFWNQCIIIIIWLFNRVADLRTIKQLSAAGHHQECIQACQEAFQVEPEQAIAYKYAGKSFLALGQIEQAQKLLIKSHQLDKSDPETTKDIGNSYLQLQDIANARKWYQASLVINKDYAPAINNIANLDSQSGNHNSALELFKQAIAADPNLFPALLGAASSAIALNQPDKAIAFAINALEISPNTLKAHELLGIAYQNTGQQEKAIEHYKKEISRNSAASVSMVNLGVIFLQRKEAAESIKLLKQASIIAPNEQISLLLAQAYQNQQQWSDAISEYEKLNLGVAHNKLIPYNYGLCLIEAGVSDKAIAAFETAIKLDKDFVEAWRNIGVIHKREGRIKEAIEATKKVISLDPDNVSAHMNLGLAYSELGELDNALEATINSLAINPDNSAGINNLKALVEEVSPTKTKPNVFREAYELLLNDENTLHRNISKMFVQAFLPIFKAASNSEPIISKNNKALNQLASDWRLNKSLTLLIPPHPDIEHFLTRFRRELLILASKKQAIPDHLKPLSEALATQCFLNEYAYVQSSDEEKYVQELINMAHNSKEELNQYLAIIACYIPIYILDLKQEWLNSYPTMSEQSKTLIKTQLDEPLQEESLKKSLGDSSTISDAVSVNVKAMYEQNPYPRYRFSDFTIQDRSLNISTFIRIESTKEDLPFMEELTVNIAHPKVLIAGCGTGNQVIMASRYKNADITAFDLSKTSLAYAIRKADDYQMKNVTFKIMDILDIANQTEKFDVIECSGVLHHMQDPEAGLSALVHQLKPGGFMKLGLYSELARQQIIEARNQIKQLDIKSTPEGIRDFRGRVLNGDLYQLKGLSQLGDDFYSLSECRDLCFHVQEHRFTTESLGKLLNTHGLIFCGFMLPNSIYKTYKDRFPDDTDMTSLKDWGRFEKLHPTTFGGMYQFWVYKPT
ncbi:MULTISPECIES: class I SAM-dependent methyltransferase [Prochlorococcus]|uniref:class I SAM-dependent methyltransferase n=1 Tax=Prochlorococcus TaxID=1218 RepID=UPI0007B34EEC|nr:class I SAM-dependent methyltransferase [Prochlorococcus marinus]KZR84893.1 Demethylrebeccamycin-D-glucose O-methyltransferase [Prochlorococcus marinus str. MIT 1327]